MAPEAGSPGSPPAIANTMCPVLTDEPVDASITPVEYKGLRIGFCCNKCRRRFQADPEIYVANLPAEARAAMANDQIATKAAFVPRETNATTKPPAAKSMGEPGSRDAAEQGEDSGASGPLEFIGRFHVLVVHFPIALLLGAALAELIGLISARSFWRSAGWYCAILGALGAVAAAGLGWINAAYNNDQGMPTVLSLHRWLGTSTAVVAIAAVAVHLGATRRNSPATRRFYVALLLLAALLVGITGHLGGTLVFGPRYFGSLG